MTQTGAKAKTGGRRHGALYLHRSRPAQAAKLRPGVVLSPDHCSRWADPAKVERNPEAADENDILEYHRPHNAPSRNRCVYLVDDVAAFPHIGYDEGPVWRVAPFGRVWRVDGGWLTEIQTMLENEAPPSLLRAAAISYWSGLPCPVTVWSGYEILCDGALLLAGPFEMSDLLDPETGKARPGLLERLGLATDPKASGRHARTRRRADDPEIIRL